MYIRIVSTLDYASALNNLALLLKSRGAYDEAKEIYERAINIQKVAFGPFHPDIASSLNNLAALLFAMGDVENAKVLYCTVAYSIA